MDHIDIAVHMTVHEADISTKEIAQRLGMGYQTLINKANPQCETHKLTLREAVALQLLTNTSRIHDAISTELNLNDKPKQTIKSVLESAFKASAEHGDVMRAIHKSFEDGRFTLRERELCQREISEAINALIQLREVIVTTPTHQKLQSV